MISDSLFSKPLTGWLPVQGQFAEGLASCINSHMGPWDAQPQSQQQQLRESMARNIADAAEAAAAQSQVPSLAC